MTDSKAMMAMFDAFDNANQGLAIWDEGDNLIGFNSIYRDIFKNNMLSEPKIGINFGQSYEEASKKPEFQLSSENIKQRFAIRKQARKDKKPIENESKLENGIWLNVRETASNDGHMITVITDVTESKNSAEMQSRLSNAIDSIPSHVMFWDKDEKLIKANELAINENLKDGIKLIEGMSYSDFLTSQFEQKLYSVPEDFSLDKFVEKRLKERVELTSKSTKVRYKNGKTVIRTENKLEDGGILTILNDVSDLEKREEQERLLSASIDNMSYGIQLWDSDRKLLRTNKYIRDMNNKFGVKTEIGMTWEESMESQVENNFYIIPEQETKDSWKEKGIEYFRNFKGENTTTYKLGDESYMMVTEKKLEDGNILQVMSDVSHLKKQEEDLKRLQDGIDQMRSGMALWDSDNKLVYANKILREFNENIGFDMKPGISRIDAVRNQMSKGLLEDVGYEAAEQYNNDFITKMDSSETGTSIEFSTELEGEPRSMVNTGYRLSSGDWIQVIYDITEQKNREKELNRLFDAVNAIKNGVLLWDEKHVCAFANDAVRETQKELGFDVYPGVARRAMVQNLIDKGVFELPNGLSIDEWLNQTSELTKNKGDGYEREVKIGETTYLSNSVGLGNGAFIQNFTDVSEIKKLTDSIEKLTNPTILWDKDNKVFFCNKAAVDMQQRWGFELKPGASRLEMIKNNVKNKYFTLPVGQTEEEYLSKSIEQIRESSEGFQIETKDEEKYWLATVVGLEDGSYISTYTDISELKSQEKELKRLQDATDQMPTAMALWDTKDNLVYANKILREFQSDYGFEMKPGINRIDMLRNQISKGAMNYGDRTAEQFHRDFLEMMDASDEGAQVEFETEFKGETRSMLANGFRLDSGDWIQTVTNITEQKKKETELQRLYDAIYNLPTAILIWSKEDKLIFGNRVAREDNKKTYKVDLSEGVERHAHLTALNKAGAFSLPENMTIKEMMFLQKGRMIEKTEGISFEAKVGNKTFMNNSRILEDGGLIENITDITIQKEHEQAVEIQKERYSTVLGDLKAIVFETDLSKNSISYEVPEAMKSFWGDTSTTWNAEEAYDVVHPNFKSDYIKAFKDHIKGLTSEIDIEHVNINKGSETWFHTRGKATYENRRAIKITGLVENIEARKELETKVEEAQQQVNNAINNIQAGILFWDKDDKLVLGNNYMESVFGTELAIGKTFREGSDIFFKSGIFDLKDQSFDEFINNRIKEREKILDTEVSYLPPTKDGKILQIASKRLPDNGLLQIFYDITDLKAREKDLETTVNKLNIAKEQADGANKAKSQFLANMSHELRTPLNAVIGLTEMLKEDAEDDGNDDYLEPLERIHGASKHLLNLINDVLDLSKIEAGKVELYNENFSLPALLEEVADTSRTLVEKKKQQIIVKY